MTDKTISRLKRWGLALLIIAAGVVSKCIDKEHESNSKFDKAIKYWATRDSETVRHGGNMP